MAKKKIIESPDGSIIEPEVVKVDLEEKKIEEAVKEVEETMEKPDNRIDETAVAIDKLPDYAQKAFKLYPDADELYIDSKGGVFPKGTQPALVGSAILFKNPNINN